MGWGRFMSGLRMTEGIAAEDARLFHNVARPFHNVARPCTEGKRMHNHTHDRAPNRACLA